MVTKLSPLYKSLSIFLILFLLISSITITAKAETQTKTNYALSALEPPVTPNVTARSAIAMDFDTGEVLFERDIDTVRSLASMTKNMTAFIVYEEIAAGNLTLDTMIRVSQHAVNESRRVDWHRSTIFNTVGAYYSVNTMLKLIMLPSHNGASVALAEHIAGSVPEFTERMNEEATRLGINAWFVDSHGSAPNVASARAKAILVRTFITEHPDILRITSMNSMSFRGDTVPNTNLLLAGREFFFEGADGFKTGTSAAAGHNLSATAMRDGRRVITIVMGAPNNNGRYGDTRALLNFGFAALEYRDMYLAAFADEPMPLFRDIRRHWGRDSIERAYELELFMGVGNNLFAPDGHMTRAAFVTVLGRMANSLGINISSSGQTEFEDVPLGMWFSNYVAWAFEAGIVSGLHETYFGANNAINRQEVATMLYRFMNNFDIELPGAERMQFTDVYMVNDWALSAMTEAVRTGLVTGHYDGRLAPRDNATRAQLAVIFLRFIDAAALNYSAYYYEDYEGAEADAEIE